VIENAIGEVVACLLAPDALSERMDGALDFEMPSSKRARLEAQSPNITSKLAQPTDDMDDIYGTPPVPRASPPRTIEHYGQAVGKIPSIATEKLPQLPGLGFLHDHLSPSKDNGQTAGHDIETPKLALTSEDAEGVAKSAVIEQEQPKREVAAEGENNSSNGPAVAPDALPRIDVPAAKRDITEIALPTIQLSDESDSIEKDKGIPHSKLPQATIQSRSLGEDTKTEIASALQTADMGADPATEAAPGVSEGIFAAVIGDIGEAEILKVDEPIQYSETSAPAVSDFEKLTESDKPTKEAEFEMDSSPLASSSNESSDTSSSNDDSEGEDYMMLDPEEAARRLMAEDGASDDDRPGKGGRVISGIPRTLNEKPDEVVPKPDVTITPDMNLDKLGLVENVVENLALIKANTSGEYQVLESGSVLCLEDRSVIGVVAETLGRVQQPYYSVRFTNANAIREAGITQSTTIFYVKQFSSTVFTQPLKAYKGSDASNLHDEEIGDDELEFSDDEAEAEHKRNVKEKKRAKHEARHGQADGFSYGSSKRSGRPPNGYSNGLPSWQEHPLKCTDLSLNYDDVKEEHGDDLYTPLARPSNLHELMAGEPPSVGSNTNYGVSHRGGRDRGGHDRGKGARGRGNRGGDRGGRGDRRHQGGRGGHRGGNQGESQNPRAQPSVGQSSPSMPQSNGFSQPPQNSIPPRPPQANGYFSQPGHINGFQPYQSPQQPPMPPPVYTAQSQAQSYPNYLAQYPNGNGQAYPQLQQHQNYPSQYPQQQYNPQYYPPQQPSPQSYQTYQSFGYPQFTAHQTSPVPPSPSNIPPGAHINPNFFRSQTQLQPQQWQQQPSPANGNANERGGYTSNDDFAKYI